MAYIKQIKNGSTTYDLKAAQLATSRTIDGVGFDGSSNIVHAGVCNTDFLTDAKTVSITGYSLTTNSIIWVAFVNGVNSINNMTLNVNSTGNKNVVIAGDYSIEDFQWMYTDSYVPLLYDGTNWILLPCGLSNYKVVKVKGNTSSFALTTTKKILTLDVLTSDVSDKINTNIFTLTGGGIQVKKSGFYRISGSCVVSISAAANIRQLYLEKVANNTTWSASNGTVINSSMCYTNNTGGAPFSVQPTVCFLDINDKVYLVGLVNAGTGTANLSHNCTNLTIEYLGLPNYLT